MIQWAWLPEFHEVATFDFFQLQAAGFSEFVFNFPPDSLGSRYSSLELQTLLLHVNKTKEIASQQPEIHCCKMRHLRNKDLSFQRLCLLSLLINI